MDNNQNDFNQTNTEQENNTQAEFEQPATEPVVTLEPEPIIKKPILAVKDNLFLVMCILISVATVFSFELIELLLAIGMWIAYANVKSDKSLVSPAKLCATAMKVGYILTWVVSVIALVCGIILLVSSVALPAIFAEAGALDVIYESEELGLIFDEFATMGIAQELLILMAFIFLSVFLIVLCVVMILLNIFFIKNAYKFAESVRDNIEYDGPILKAKTVSTWVLVLAIFQGVSALGSIGNFSAFVSTGATVALFIITYMWLKKYFVEQ